MGYLKGKSSLMIFDTHANLMLIDERSELIVGVKFLHILIIFNYLPSIKFKNIID